MSLRNQSAMAAAAAVVLTGSRFIVAAAVARKVSAEGFGVFVYAQWLVDIAFLCCSLGATGAASRYMAEFRNNEDRLRSFISAWGRYALLLPLCAGGAVVLGERVSGVGLSAQAEIALAMWAISSGFWLMQTSALSGLQRFEMILLSNCISAAVMLVGVLVLPIQSYGPELIFACMALANFLAALPGVRFVAERVKVGGSPSVLSIEERALIRAYAFNMWVIALLWALVWSRGEVAAVRYYLGDKGVANYAAALALFNGAVQGVTLGVSAVAPQLTKLLGAGQDNEALAIAKKVMDIQLLVCGCASLILVCLGPELLVIVFGDGYKAQFVTLGLLSLGLVSLAISNQNHMLQIVTGGQLSRNVAVAGLLVLFLLSALLIPLEGVRGAGEARMVTLIFSALVSGYFFLKRWEGRGISVKSFFGVFISSSTAFLLVVFVSEGNFYVRFAILIVAVFLLFLLLPVRGENSLLFSFFRKKGERS